MALIDWGFGGLPSATLSGRMLWCVTELKSVRKHGNSCGRFPRMTGAKSAGEWRKCVKTCVVMWSSFMRRVIFTGCALENFRVLFLLAGDIIQVYAVKDRKETYE